MSRDMALLPPLIETPSDAPFAAMCEPMAPSQAKTQKILIRIDISLYVKVYNPILYHTPDIVI